MITQPRNAATWNSLNCNIHQIHIQVQVLLYCWYPIFFLSFITVKIQSSLLGLRDEIKVCSRVYQAQHEKIKAASPGLICGGAEALGWNTIITKDNWQPHCCVLKERYQQKSQGTLVLYSWIVFVLFIWKCHFKNERESESVFNLETGKVELGGILISTLKVSLP